MRLSLKAFTSVVTLAAGITIYLLLLRSEQLPRVHEVNSFTLCRPSLYHSDNSETTAVINLAKPVRRFHSHSWYHIGEHYLAYGANLSSHTVLSKAKQLVLLSPSNDFVEMLNPTGMLLLLLSFAPLSVQRVELFWPVHSSRAIEEPNFKSKYGMQTITVAASGPVWVYERVAHPDRRFTRIEQGPSVLCRRGILVGSVGKTPVPRDRWFNFPTPRKATARMREKLADLCAASGDISPAYSSVAKGELSSPSGDASPSRHVLIYQRDNTRRFHHLHNLVNRMYGDLLGNPALDVRGYLSLRSRIRNRWSLGVELHNDTGPPCALYRRLSTVDVLVTPHGFQSMMMLFMQPHSLLIEIFNFRYFRDGYRVLAEELGLSYFSLKNKRPTSLSRLVLLGVPEYVCMQFNRCRHFARTDDVSVSSVDRSQIVAVIRKHFLGRKSKEV
jgi:hypothetical protein